MNFQCALKETLFFMNFSAFVVKITRWRNNPWSSLFHYTFSCTSWWIPSGKCFPYVSVKSMFMSLLSFIQRYILALVLCFMLIFLELGKFC